MTPRRDHSAIVIAIGQYPGFGVSLPSAMQSAERFVDWLTKVDGTPARNIHVLHSPLKGLIDVPPDAGRQDPSLQEAYPTRREIDRAIWQLGLGSDLIVGKRLYVFLSGLGFRDSNDGLSLLTADASMESLMRAMSIGQYLFYLRGAGAFKEIVLVADLVSIYAADADSFMISNPLPPPFPKPPRATKEPPNEVMMTLLAPSGGTAGRLTEALLGEMGKEKPDLSHATLNRRLHLALSEQGLDPLGHRLSVFASGEPVGFGAEPAPVNARLSVYVPHWAAEVEVSDSMGDVWLPRGPVGMRDGGFGVELDLAPGVYEVEVSLEGECRRELIGLRPGQVATLPATRWDLKPGSAAPLLGMAETQDAHALAAAVQSTKVTWSGMPPGDSRLFIFMRSMGDKSLTPTVDPPSLIRLLDWKGDLVTDFSSGWVADEDAGWWAFNALLPAGPYVLHRRAAGNVRERYNIVHLSPGWATQLFIPSQWRPSLRRLAVLMRRIDEPFDPKDKFAMASEALADGLRRGLSPQRINADYLETLLKQEHANPLLGILAAYALHAIHDGMMDADPARATKMGRLADEVVARLTQVLPDHPDVRALASGPGLQGAVDPENPSEGHEAGGSMPFWHPPTLRAGLARLERFARKQIPPGSLTECLLKSYTTGSAWMSWRRLQRTPRVCQTPATPPGLAREATAFRGTFARDAVAVPSPSAAIYAVAADVLPPSLPVYPLAREDVRTAPGGPVQTVKPLLDSPVQDISLFKELHEMMSPTSPVQLPPRLDIDSEQSALRLVQAIRPEDISAKIDVTLDHAHAGVERLKEAASGSLVDDPDALQFTEVQKIAITQALRPVTAESDVGAIQDDSVAALAGSFQTLEATAARLLAEAEELTRTSTTLSARGFSHLAPAAADRLRKAASAVLNSADLVAITDPDGRLAFSNGAFMALVQGEDAARVRKVWEEVFNGLAVGTSTVDFPSDALASGPITFNAFEHSEVRRTAILDPRTQQPRAFVNAVRNKDARPVGDDLQELEPLLSSLSLYTSIYAHSETPSAYVDEIEDLSKQIEALAGRWVIPGT